MTTTEMLGSAGGVSDNDAGEFDEASLFTPMLELDDTVFTTADGTPVVERVAGTMTATPKDDTTRELLNALLPPLAIDSQEAGEAPIDERSNENEDEDDPDRDNRLHMRVSSMPASREDVIELQLKLDERLQIRQAREVGLCPVREELYSQTMDELIRQITIECPERGLMLLRVRDEARMTMATYATLHKSSIAFGMRKAVEAEQGLFDLEQTLAAKKERKQALTVQLEEFRAELIEREKLSGEKRAMAEKKRQEETEFLKHQQQHLTQYMKQHAHELKALNVASPKDGGEKGSAATSAADQH